MDATSSLAFRDNYGAHGVVGYYTRFGSSYTNPHNDVITRALASCLNRWVSIPHVVPTSSSVHTSKTAAHTRTTTTYDPRFHVRIERVLDLACGSGEATICIEQWAIKHAYTVHQQSSLQPDDQQATDSVPTTQPQPQQEQQIGNVQQTEPTTTLAPTTSATISSSTVLVTATDPYTAEAFVSHGDNS
jgi:hypothetical protein